MALLNDAEEEYMLDTNNLNKENKMESLLIVRLKDLQFEAAERSGNTYSQLMHKISDETYPPITYAEFLSVNDIEVIEQVINIIRNV